MNWTMFGLGYILLCTMWHQDTCCLWCAVTLMTCSDYLLLLEFVFQWIYPFDVIFFFYGMNLFIISQLYSFLLSTRILWRYILFLMLTTCMCLPLSVYVPSPISLHLSAFACLREPAMIPLFCRCCFVTYFIDFHLRIYIFSSAYSEFNLFFIF